MASLPDRVTPEQAELIRAAKVFFVASADPSLEPGLLEDGGNLQHSLDFRSTYTTLLERWMGVDAKPIVGGSFEQLDFV